MKDSILLREERTPKWLATVFCTETAETMRNVDGGNLTEYTEASILRYWGDTQRDFLKKRNLEVVLEGNGDVVNESTPNNGRRVFNLYQSAEEGGTKDNPNNPIGHIEYVLTRSMTETRACISRQTSTTPTGSG